MMTKRLSAAFYRASNGAEPVREWLRSLPGKERKAIGTDVRAVEIGWPLGLPLCRPIRDGIWEVRTRMPHGRAMRVLFCIRGSDMVLLHGFEKKSQKAPRGEVDLAVRRMKGLTK